MTSPPWDLLCSWWWASNDPFTAIACIHWLRNGMVVAAKRRAPAARRYDDEGHLRVITRPLTFEDLIQAMVGKARPFVCTDRLAAEEMMRAISEAISAVGEGHRRELLLRHADNLLAACHQQLPLTIDRAAVALRHTQLRQLVRPSFPVHEHTRDADGWLDATA